MILYMKYKVYYMDKLDLFTDLKNHLQTKNCVKRVQLDEDFIPPHKSASHTPYDAILCLDDSFMNEQPAVGRETDPSLNRIIEQNACEDKEQAVKKLLRGVMYEEITGVTENTTSEPGDYLAYISLRTPDWISK